MMYVSQLKNRRLRPGAIATILIAVLATSCGTTQEATDSLPPAPPTADVETEASALPPDPAPSPETPTPSPTAVREEPAQV
ncbi:MAG: hypothetical protein SVX43_19580, partial [Cyanobacteriota bacterium]|nr:hypothetical protein [Cyanobacteriota bacterium]